MKRGPASLSRALLVALVLTAFSLRMYHLAQPLLSWDEGWSIGLSSLGWAEINRITVLDVHPPLYYYAFKLWLAAGKHEVLLRFLSVLVGVLTIPLAYVTGRIWHSQRVGILAALATAISPFLIYYSQVARMYSLCATLSLLATCCLLKAIEGDRTLYYIGFVLSAVTALYTFYYTACVIAAVLIYALFARSRRWRALLMSAVVIAALYVPWLLHAVPPMLARVGARTGFALTGADALRFLADGVFGLVFAYGTGWVTVGIIFMLLVVAVLLAWHRRESNRCLVLPLLVIALSLAAVSVGARAHMFAARYLIAASPFLALLTAWAISLWWQHSRWLGILALVLLVASAGPSLTGYVYEKPYEISGQFDPQADYRYLEGRTFPDDIVFFNVLSLAGHYERFRAPDDPLWSYALRWDPVVEPLEQTLSERVRPATSQHRSLWFVLYKGTVAANRELKEWLDVNLFPAFGQWREDTLYEQYLPPTAEMTEVTPGLVFDGHIALEAAAYTARSPTDDRVTVQLTWTAGKSVTQSYKVFVHLYTMDGRMVAQHDALPVNNLRPTWSWQPGERIIDNHGLWVPADTSGPLRLVVGLYDPESNARLVLPDGSDHASVGIVEIVSE
ncbi:MAG TPA: glycosyltransferase family 39 protein [Anaerolineae bacterium]|nr:glycosyltransferase family 39 protein [Anaerolineae bacterium]